MPACLDPSRATLPFAQWPAGDRLAWEQAIATGDPLEDEGPAAHWAPRTKQTNLQHYGRWLGWLLWRDILDPNATPTARVTRELVGAYNRHLSSIVAPRTRLSMLVGLKVMMQAMAPRQSWRWLQDTCNRIQRTAKPKTDKRGRVRPSCEISAAALAELRRLPAPIETLTEAIRYRDALMLALMVARPLRKMNVAALTLGQHLRKIGSAWLITLAANETKTKQPIEYWFPDHLLGWLERYLSEVRPLFPGAAESKCLWLNQYGPDLGSQFVYFSVTRLTKRLLGGPLNPHLLRDCAASSLAMESADLARAAAPLLGHRHFSTTERYYIQANNLEASRRLNMTLKSLKTSLEQNQ